MSQDKLEHLLSLYVEGRISREDYEQLFDRLKNNPDDEHVNSAIDHIFRKMKTYAVLTDNEKEVIYQNIISNKRFDSSGQEDEDGFNMRRIGNWKRIMVAASVLLLISTALYFYTNRIRTPQLVQRIQPVAPKVISPGGDKAVLTLSDGSRIILDNAKNGVLANQEGVSIQKTSDGKLLYTFSNSDKVVKAGDIHVIYNKIETPRGGKYEVNLPDGSKVWLNASSSLRFPALFAGKTREVELTGEAFFDVAKNPDKPFKVITKDQVVEVLGTQFNINSYSDEGPIKTTLIEGSVKIIYKDQVVLLSPGEQFRPQSSIAKVIPADTEEVVAWKKGYFLFKNEDIKSIMRKLSRWYDVDVSYSGEIPGVGFGGNISRSKDISEVLNVLQLTNAVHFKVDERRITVMP